MIYTKEELDNKIEFLKDENFSNRTKVDQSYMLMIKKILFEGIVCKNRTGIDTIALSGYMLEHNMSEGFPLLTNKKVLFSVLATELEGFIKGIIDKKWYKDRGCNIWNSWKNPFSTIDDDDLGPIYGYQWRRFNCPPDNCHYPESDQLQNVVSNLIDKKGSNNRRLIVSAWNPQQLKYMALAPCHVLFQLSEMNEKLDLVWFQRSCDTILGIPFNLASYALLLELICKTTGHIPGKVIGMLSNVHIYENQIDPLLDKLIPQTITNENNITTLPKLEIKESFKDVFNFEAAKDVEVIDYQHDLFVKFPSAAV